MPFIALRVFGWEAAAVDESWRLRDIPQGHALSVCNSVACDDCGALFMDIRFDDEEMAALYEDYRGEAYTSMRSRFEPSYSNRNERLLKGCGYLADVEGFITPHVPEVPRVLDWGGDTGRSTPFRGRAALHHVYDISGQPVIDGAESVGIDVVRATSYDVIVLSNVLEHMPSPRTALCDIAAIMNSQTILYIEVPHEDIVQSWERPRDRLAQKRHWHEHINFFSTESLDRLLEHAGLSTVARRSTPVSVGGRDARVFSILASLAS